MRSGSTAEATEVIQGILISDNAKTEAKLEIEVNGSWEYFADLDMAKGIDWTESGKIEKFGSVAITPLCGTIGFDGINENGRYSDGSGTVFENILDLDTRVRLQIGYRVGDILSEDANSLNLNRIATDPIKSYFYRMAHSVGTVILDASGPNASTHFSDIFIPLYDSETYDDSFYSPDAYTVQTYDTNDSGSVEDHEDFTRFTITANNAIGDVYYRSFNDPSIVGISTFSDWTSAGKLENGTKSVDFTDIEDKRFIQIAVVYDGIAWGDGHIISDITVYTQDNIDWIYKSVYYLDTPGFDDPAAPNIPKVFCAGRDIWKRAIATDINIEDYSGSPISPTDLIKSIADKCNIRYTSTSIATITGFPSVTWGDGFGDIKKANQAFEFVMQKINPSGYQMFIKYDEDEDDNVLFVQLKPNVLEGEGAFSYKNYIGIDNNRKNSDKMLQRFSVLSDSQIPDAEEQLDQESISGTGDTVFSWAGNAIYKRFEADLPDNITGTVVVTPTSATLTVTAITGTVVVTLFGNKWKSTEPTYQGEAINFKNQLSGKGTTNRSENPLMTSDAECKTMAESFGAGFADPVQEAQGLRWPYVNLLPEINDVYMLWRRFIFRDNLYFITKASHHWDRGIVPRETTSFNLDDSGRNFSESSDFIYDDEPTPIKYGVGFVYDMGISTPISTDQEIDDASIIIRNIACS